MNKNQIPPAMPNVHLDTVQSMIAALLGHTDFECDFPAEGGMIPWPPKYAEWSVTSIGPDGDEHEHVLPELLRELAAAMELQDPDGWTRE